MKKTILALSLALSPFAMAQSSQVLSCEGRNADTTYTLEVYKGDYGYEASFDLSVLSDSGGSSTQHLDAVGGSYAECGTRAVPCGMIEIAQYSSAEAGLILTMISPLGAPTANASLAVRPQDGEETTVEMSCTKIAQVSAP